MTAGEDEKPPERKLRKVTITLQDDPVAPRKVNVTLDTDMTDEEKTVKQIPQSPTYVKLFHIMQLFAPQQGVKGKAVKKGEKPRSAAERRAASAPREGVIHVPPASNSRKPAKVLVTDRRPL